MVLIASLILNLAFISGFTFRKFQYPHVSKKSGPKYGRYLCENGHQKPDFSISAVGIPNLRKHFIFIRHIIVKENLKISEIISS